MATDYHAVIQENIQKQNGTYESNANPFGICGTCGCELEPSYFVEEEEIIQHGVRFKTGRVRRAVDCLVCPIQLRATVKVDLMEREREQRRRTA